MIHAAAETFPITPKVGARGDHFSGKAVSTVFSPIKSTVILLESQGERRCLITSHFMTDRYPFSNLLRRRVAEVLDVGMECVFTFSSHNHSSPPVSLAPHLHGAVGPEDYLEESELSAVGRRLIKQAAGVARKLPRKLAPVQIGWGMGHERRISYNRKGRRADGSTYFMREEDRLLLGKDFNGDIVDDAPVVGFIGLDGKPVAFLTHFTAHPVTTYKPGSAIAFGEYPQVACDYLSAAFDAAPVGFLQGCAGDHNAKGLLSKKSPEESVADATKFGRYLGQTYVRAVGRLDLSDRSDMAHLWRTVRLPFKKVPSRKRLEGEIVEMDEFLARCERGDANTQTCVGLNFASNMPLEVRAGLIRGPRQWAEWALSLHKKRHLRKAPTHLEFLLGVLRVGDVGIVGMPCEAFSGIGRLITAGSPLPLTLPCGYMNNSAGYVPDGANVGDTEYMSSFYRYSSAMLPYKHPAGDALARAGLRMLKTMNHPYLTGIGK